MLKINTSRKASSIWTEVLPKDGMVNVTTAIELDGSLTCYDSRYIL